MFVSSAPVQRSALRNLFGVEPPASEWKAQDLTTSLRRLDQP